MTKVLAFLLAGEVQGVKMRRYVESAARYFGLAGYVINTQSGDVFGEAWERQHSVQVSLEDRDPCNIDKEQKLDQFMRWVRGEWEPKVYHNIKPTPIGTAYPEKARVHRCATLYYSKEDMEPVSKNNNLNLIERFDMFTMVRDDKEAEALASELIEIQMQLSDDGAAATCTWPKPKMVPFGSESTASPV